jgi:hypothetical protein
MCWSFFVPYNPWWIHPHPFIFWNFTCYYHMWFSNFIEVSR